MLTNLLLHLRFHRSRDAFEQSIARAVEQTRQELKKFCIPIHRIETLVPFDLAIYDVGVWFFYETEQQRNRAEASAERETLCATFRNRLTANRYPASLLQRVTFEFDSHETVMRDYEGNYFLRLR